MDKKRDQSKRLSQAHKRLINIKSTTSRISIFTTDSAFLAVSKSKSNVVALESSGSDHVFKSKGLRNYRRAVSKLNEERCYEDVIRNISKISAHQLYNLLNQETSQYYSKLSDPNFLLILDTRSPEEFKAGHIVTSRHINFVDGEFQPLYGWDLECKQNIVVYDTFSLFSDPTSRAFQCALMIHRGGSRYPIRILNGGYAEFCKFYPDYNTIQIIYTPTELDTYPTYPNEIIPGKLYLGRLYHAQVQFVHKELKIRAHVNCGIKESVTTYFPDNYPFKFYIPLEENQMEPLNQYFVPAADFIESNAVYNHAVLVYSESGNSISAVIVIAYLVLKGEFQLETAYRLVKQCRTSIRPLLQHMTQLAELKATHLNLDSKTYFEKLIREC